MQKKYQKWARSGASFHLYEIAKTFRRVQIQQERPGVDKKWNNQARSSFNSIIDDTVSGLVLENERTMFEHHFSDKLNQ